jgi:hypothetical protein
MIAEARGTLGLKKPEDWEKTVQFVLFCSKIIQKKYKTCRLLWHILCKGEGVIGFLLH